MRGMIVYVLLVALLAGCASAGRTVSERRFQKRTYRPGWHVDLGLGRSARSRSAPDEQPVAELPRRADLRRPALPPRTLLTTTAPGSEAVEAIVPTTFSGERGTVQAPTTIIQTHQPPNTKPMGTETKARWNIPSLIAIGLVALALLSVIIQGGSEFFGYLLIATFVAGLIGLISAIARKERGKGFAIAALVFSIGFVITLLVALNKLS